MECRCCAKGIEVTENRSEGDLKIARSFEKNIGRTIDTISFTLLLGRCKFHWLTANELHELFTFRGREKLLQKSRLKLNELHRASSQTSKTIIWSSRRTRHVKSYFGVKFGNWIGADGVLDTSLDFFFAIHTRLGLMLSYIL
jgi:hypothetical protein